MSVQLVLTDAPNARWVYQIPPLFLDSGAEALIARDGKPPMPDNAVVQ